MPTLAPGEYGLATDTEELFVGGEDGNIQVATLTSSGLIPVAQIPGLSASKITSGTLPITRGGTGAATAAAARTALGAAAASHTHTTAQITGLDDALEGKQGAITGGASTITEDNLTASRALVSNSSGKVAASAVTATELGYLDGVTSAIQTQLNGKAASSHGTHVTYSTTAPAAAGTASAGSAATVARSDHVHPAQTTVSGNAGSATKLATARTIRTNLASTATASFNGTANITPGVTGTLPIANGGTGGTTADAARTNLGAAEGQNKSGTVSGAGWHRVAMSRNDIQNNIGVFTIEAKAIGKHTNVILAAGISHGVHPTVSPLTVVNYSNPEITKARIVYHTIYSGHYAYLDVYTSSSSTTLDVSVVNAIGWTVVNQPTAAAVESGYTTKEFTLTQGLEAGARIETGTYAGTGKSGAPAPNSLTFSFPPKILMVMDESEEGFYMTALSGVEKAITKHVISVNMSSEECTLSWDGNTVKWWFDYYEETTAFTDRQLNESGHTYYYAAIG